MAHFLRDDKKRIRKSRKQDKDNLSLEKLLDKGFQPVGMTSVEKEIAKRNREQRYLNSYDYKKFRKSLQKEIRSKMDKIPDYLKPVMFLRFFKNYSIGQIAKTLGISRGTAQQYIARGCKRISGFLNRDIKKQDEIEKNKKMIETKSEEQTT